MLLNLFLTNILKLVAQKYSKLNLIKTSYVRTHKSFTIHEKELIKEVANLKILEPDLYLEILHKYEQWTKEVVTNAL